MNKNKPFKFQIVDLPEPKPVHMGPYQPFLCERCGCVHDGEPFDYAYSVRLSAQELRNTIDQQILESLK